jgi:myo-inositol-1(or 4)-monophosphatase
MQSVAPSPSELLSTAIEAAQQAGAEIRSQRESQRVTVSFKGTRDLVTTADLAAEKIIVDTIRSRYPDHHFLAEESHHADPARAFGEGTFWVIDPVDGTTNYAHGHPHVGISIACVVNGTTVAAVVFSPFQNELFTATKNGGAFLNGAPISISAAPSVSQALIATGFPYHRHTISTVCARLERCLLRCRDVRRLGAASLDICWVACGRLDAFFEETLNPWDGAAGCLIATEAGAVVAHYDYDNDLQRKTAGLPHDLFMDNIVVCGPQLLGELLAILNNAETSP